MPILISHEIVFRCFLILSKDATLNPVPWVNTRWQHSDKSLQLRNALSLTAEQFRPPLCCAVTCWADTAFGKGGGGECSRISYGFVNPWWWQPQQPHVFTTKPTSQNQLARNRGFLLKMQRETLCVSACWNNEVSFKNVTIIIQPASACREMWFKGWFYDILSGFSTPATV